MFFKFLTQRQLHPDQSGSYSLSDIDNDDDAPVKEPEKEEPEPEDPEEDPDENEEKDEPAAKPKKEKAAEPEPEPEPEPDAPETDEPEPEEDEEFWNEVDEIRGLDPLDVDYGDVDPMSPAGAALREEAVERRALLNFEASLKESNPRAYAYLVHTMEGGSEESFFDIAGKPAEIPTDDELEADVSKQEAIVARDLKAKGLNDKMIERNIRMAKEDDDLEEMAKEAAKNIRKQESDSVAAVEAEAEKARTVKQNALKQIGSYVSEVVSSGKIDNITIPEKERAAFAKSLTESIRYDNGKFVIVTELNNDNVSQVFKEKFFGHMKGDLKELVEKEAKTQNARRLKATIKPDKRVRGVHENPGFTTLSDV